MLRFRNPGTQFSTQVQVLKLLYNTLGAESQFTLEDMALIIAQEKLMTAYGYSGNTALQLCKNSDKSRDSAYNNAKMYAEVFRMLGWVTPARDTSYPLVFTYIASHIAESEYDCHKLYEQCVLGINNPTELTDKMSYNENIRFFKCTLQALIDLGSLNNKELCLGPMSVNDNSVNDYKNMINHINNVRAKDMLTQEFDKLSQNLGMAQNSVINCTRMPKALLKACGYIEDKTSRKFKITQYGIDTYSKIKVMKDLRLKKFNSYNEDIQLSLIRLGIYSMLQRAGYDLSDVKDVIVADNKKCEHILKGRELLFSPYQTIKRTLIEKALGVEYGTKLYSEERPNTFTQKQNKQVQKRIKSLNLNVNSNIDKKILCEKNVQNFYEKIINLKKKFVDNKKIIEHLFKEYRDSDLYSFYPLVVVILKILGFKNVYSRQGDNGARWDAIVIDDEKSIPIEMKSPKEIPHISIKAIQQALENKIILLSRKTYITDKKTTSLAIGYYLPNERAEVNALISDIKNTYGYSIGVIDLKSLLSIAVSIVIDGKTFDKRYFYELEGLANANI